jgi:dynein heavy chain, axonemal
VNLQDHDASQGISCLGTAYAVRYVWDKLTYVATWPECQSRCGLHVCAVKLLIWFVMQDLFPNSSVADQISGNLAAAVNTAAVSLQLQPVSALISKCLQLHDTLAVRFGVMLIGDAAGGKTSIYRTLQEAMNRLIDEDAASGLIRKTAVHVLNPKVASIGQLYGQYSELTGDWNDGLASAICRTAANECSTESQWIVFDGPVDQLWIESMNTVLDDNCMLCLFSGERMKLNPEAMRMLFEADDLSAASPATVSRCGMVYVPEAALPWDSVMQQWLQSLSKTLGLSPYSDAGGGSDAALHLPMELVTELKALINAYVPRALAWIEEHAALEDIPATRVQRLRSLQLWLQALLHSSGAWDYKDAFGPAEKAALCYVFAFSFVWGLGGNLNSNGRDKWDKFVRQLFDGVANFPAGSGTVFDFCCDSERNFTFKVCTSQMQGSPQVTLFIVHMQTRAWSGANCCPTHPGRVSVQHAYIVKNGCCIVG